MGGGVADREPVGRFFPLSVLCRQDETGRQDKTCERSSDGSEPFRFIGSSRGLSHASRTTFEPAARTDDIWLLHRGSWPQTRPFVWPDPLRTQARAPRAHRPYLKYSLPSRGGRWSFRRRSPSFRPLQTSPLLRRLSIPHRPYGLSWKSSRRMKSSIRSTRSPEVCEQRRSVLLYYHYHLTYRLLLRICT